MFVTDDQISAMVQQYGVPEERTFGIAVTEKEFNRIKASQVDGRNHDVTAYIKKGDDVIVIAKHIYPPDLYRAPSGGLKPGEDFHTGLFREVSEETGCKIEIERFVMRTAVSFIHGGQMIYWRSFIFLCNYLSGDFDYTDKDEIREVRLAGWDEFEEFGRIMRQTDLGGLHYRAVMHEELEKLL